MDYQKMGNNDDDLTKREVMNMGIINQYGQLMGELSRLDDELWLCKSDDNDGFVHSTAALHWDVFSNNVELKKLSHIVDDSFSNGSSAVAKGSSSSLADSSLDQSPAPIPTPQSKRTYLNVRTSVTKRARTKRHRSSIFNSHLNNPNTDRPLSDEMAEPAIRTKKVEDLLHSRDSEPPTPTPKRKLPKRGIKKCAHCESTRTPQWREGPLGRGTLCNACGVRFKHGRLCPEYQSRGPERREGNPSSGPKPTPERKLSKRTIKKCAHCESTRTPQWREGPLGRGTLCNACGVQFKHGRLFPEYRPLSSPHFDPSLHSNMPKKVQQMRMNKEC